MNASIENIQYTIKLLQWLLDREEGEMITTGARCRNSILLDNEGMDGDIDAAMDDARHVTGVLLVRGIASRRIYYVEKG